MAQTIGSLDLNAFSDLYNDSNQYFWFESSSSATYGAGVHITLSPDTSFIANPTGQNILMNTDGISIRNGLLPMMTLDNNSLDFNIVDTTAGTYTTTATFTATGAQIGQSDGAHSVIDASGQRFYVSTVNGIIQLANIGYGEVNDGSANVMGAYYSFGKRDVPTNTYSTSTIYSIGDTCIYNGTHYVCIADMNASGTFNSAYWNKIIGALSFASGFSTIASGYASHAEGNSTKAVDMHTHAEGQYTIASMSSSHAEGYMTHANGLYSHTEGRETFADAYASHAEGYQTVATWYSGSLPCGSHAEGMYTVASGQASHAQNKYTVATENNQTVIGKFNAATVSGSGTTANPYTYSNVGDYAFIIGNGTDNTTAKRSNAFTVDWDGNVVASGNVISNNLIGEIKQYAGLTVPTGWLECDGSEVAIADYPLLYGAIGNLWGTPSDANHFVLPDFKGKVPVGYDSSQTEFDTVGESGGEKTHTLTEAQIPAHTHGAKLTNGSVRLYKGNQTTTASGSISFSSKTDRQYEQSGTSTNSWQTATFTLNHTHASVGGSGAHNNLQPYAVVKYIICAV